MEKLKEWQYYLLLGVFLAMVAVAKVLDKWRKKEVTSKVGFFASFLFSMIGGILAGFIADVYIDKVQLQWVFIAGGAWMGERLLEAVSGAIEEYISRIFKSNKDE